MRFEKLNWKNKKDKFPLTEFFVTPVVYMLIIYTAALLIGVLFVLPRI